MDLFFESEQFLVVDDFLGSEALQELWYWFQVAPFFSNDLRGLHGAFNLDDGRVMRGPDIYAGPVAQEVARAKQGSFAHPTGTAIDLLVDAFLGAASQFEKVVGSWGKDYRTVALAPRLYERGSGLYFHRDSPSVVTGSCTFYVHPEWNVQWGGELFVAHPSTRAIPEDHGPHMRAPREVMGRGPTQLAAHLDNRELNAALMESAMGQYIMPKPNRLVVMQTGNPHMVNKVQPAAGDRVRASVTMFLIRPGQEASRGR